MDDAQMATFDITFHHPAQYTVLSIGTRTDSVVHDKEATTHWVSTAPTHNATLNMGKFELYKETAPDVPPVSVLFSESGHHDLGVGFRNMQKQIGGDVANALKFFQTVYGPGPTTEFSVSEIPWFHGEAFPGAVQLSFITFLAQDKTGDQDIFRAHEVAHQWWGVGVDDRSYHDQWLHEGFAEFSGLWYMQAVHHDNKLYFDQLNSWRDDIVKAVRPSRDSQPLGPISLGYRAAGVRTNAGADLVVYQKGAWVLHMLRMLMIDLRTMKEDKFTETMKDYYATYRGQTATTADFQAVVEKHLGLPMDWFFKEWVDGIAVPKYTVTTKTTRDGSVFKVHLHVVQENAPDDFRMYVPVTIDLGQSRIAHLRVEIKSAVTDLDLPLALPAEPVRIVFNDLDGVLAEVKQ